MPRTSLDDIDRRILAALQENARTANVDLARAVGLSPSPCLRRVRELEQHKVIRSYVTLVDPGRPIPPESTAVHGLTDGMVHGGPQIERVLQQADPVVDGAVLIGHHVGCDVAILGHAGRARRLPRWRNPAIDTGRLAAVLHPEWQDVSLERVADRLGVPVVSRHTAEGDALTAGRIFLALVPELRARRLRTVGELLWWERHARSR